jgi:hypothetical protein
VADAELTHERRAIIDNGLQVSQQITRRRPEPARAGVCSSVAGCLSHTAAVTLMMCSDRDGQDSDWLRQWSSQVGLGDSEAQAASASTSRSLSSVCCSRQKRSKSSPQPQRSLAATDAREGRRWHVLVMTSPLLRQLPDVPRHTIPPGATTTTGSNRPVRAADTTAGAAGSDGGWWVRSVASW